MKPNIRALLDEYQKAISELIDVILPITDIELATVVDVKTKDEDCKSIQNILTHVINSGYGYTQYIERHLGIDFVPSRRIKLSTTAQYIESLEAMFQYCTSFFERNPNLKIEEINNAKKITTRWGQIYDIDQLLEHAIVHILRHRRQIQNFITVLR